MYDDTLSFRCIIFNSLLHFKVQRITKARDLQRFVQYFIERFSIIQKCNSGNAHVPYKHCMTILVLFKNLQTKL